MIPHLPFYESLCIPDLLNPQNVETFANIFWPHGNPDFWSLYKGPKKLVDEEHPLLFKPFEMIGLSEYVTSQAGYAAPNDAFKAYCGL
ncbi:hypothetical protein MTR67_000276 [Solanum verrucosum]|uniref:Uncharacterized protein n=1 Tax=Solanum verrucosum TaxID=315347 RepID=A0AAF0T6D9_SOLVR|nr:hypothetical protein MTR67_000276 [Solanum verrucosum]